MPLVPFLQQIFHSLQRLNELKSEFALGYFQGRFEPSFI